MKYSQICYKCSVKGVRGHNILCKKHQKALTLLKAQRILILLFLFVRKMKELSRAFCNSIFKFYKHLIDQPKFKFTKCMTIWDWVKSLPGKFKIKKQNTLQNILFLSSKKKKFTMQWLFKTENEFYQIFQHFFFNCFGHK